MSLFEANNTSNNKAKANAKLPIGVYFIAIITHCLSERCTHTNVCSVCSVCMRAYINNKSNELHSLVVCSPLMLTITRDCSTLISVSQNCLNRKTVGATFDIRPPFSGHRKSKMKSWIHFICNFACCLLLPHSVRLCADIIDCFHVLRDSADGAAISLAAAVI